MYFLGEKYILIENILKRSIILDHQTGDYIKFTVTDDFGCKKSHPINDKLYLITYVLSGWGLKDGYVVFGIKEDKNDSKKM